MIQHLHNLAELGVSINFENNKIGALYKNEMCDIDYVQVKIDSEWIWLIYFETSGICCIYIYIISLVWIWSARMSYKHGYNSCICLPNASLRHQAGRGQKHRWKGAAGGKCCFHVSVSQPHNIQNTNWCSTLQQFITRKLIWLFDLHFAGIAQLRIWVNWGSGSTGNFGVNSEGQIGPNHIPIWGPPLLQAEANGWSMTFGF